jgi:uncharacterized protein YjdB
MLNDRKWAFRHLADSRPDRRWLKTIAVLAVCGTAFGCDTTTEVLRLDDIRLNPGTIQLNAGETAGVTATLVDQHGSSFPVAESAVTWTSGNGQVATVSGNAEGAVVTGIAAGSAVIRASSRGVGGSTLVIVTPYVPPRPQPDLGIRSEK